MIYYVFLSFIIKVYPLNGCKAFSKVDKIKRMLYLINIFIKPKKNSLALYYKNNFIKSS
tara:strand:- start:302 stop:478 length:177 start_codon:yes stop_codon:yes gene_type:complete